jgi:hypothetical protein
MKFAKVTFVTIAFFLAWSTPALPWGGDPGLAAKLEAHHFKKAGPVNWIRYHHIQGWTRVDEKYVIVHAGESGDFLIKLRNRCKHLGPGMEVSFSATAGKLTTSDRINVEGAGGFIDYCYVTTINRLEKTRQGSG